MSDQKRDTDDTKKRGLEVEKPKPSEKPKEKPKEEKK